jgi:hypothetical protein
MRRAPSILGVVRPLLSAATLSGQVAIPAPSRQVLADRGRVRDQIEQQLAEAKIARWKTSPLA